MASKSVNMRVEGGLCELEFEPWIYTGPKDGEAWPGISFVMIADINRLIEREGKYHGGMGVIGRADAKRLADMIYQFLGEYERGESPNN